MGDQDDKLVEFDCSSHDLRVHGDVKLLIYSTLHGMHVRKHKKLCHLWFHTAFICDDMLRFPKKAIDGACEDKHCNVFREEFAIEVDFQRVHDSRGVTIPSNGKLADSEEEDGDWGYDHTASPETADTSPFFSWSATTMRTQILLRSNSFVGKRIRRL